MLPGGANGSRPPKLHDHVVRELAAEILRGDILPTQILPAEPTLCQRFEVSRTVIREALRVLASKGLVTIEHGRGTRVNAPEEWDSFDPLLLQIRHQYSLLQEVLSELLEVRRILELETAGLAAQRAQPRHVAAMEAAVTAMASSGGQLDAYIEADVAFHTALARAAGNGLLYAMFRPVIELIRTGVQVSTVGRNLERSVMVHRQVCDTIARRDVHGAREAMRLVVDKLEQDLQRAHGTDDDSLL